MKFILYKSKREDHKLKKRPVIQYWSKGIEWHLDILDWLFIHTIGFIPHWIQYGLWKLGYSWHDPINDLCTPGLDCCKHLIPKEMEGIFQQLREEKPIIKGKL